MKHGIIGIAITLVLTVLLGFCGRAGVPEERSYQPESSYSAESSSNQSDEQPAGHKATENMGVLSDIPTYAGQPYVTINNNEPRFAESELTTDPFETYSELDNLGRCGTAYANVCREIMPTEERGKIGMVKPTGWHTAKYDFVDGQYLYNRCHLIGYQLSAENANERNLITGTRYLNIQGMLPFENMTADYVRETNNHVLYRVTPIFEKNDLLEKILPNVTTNLEKGQVFSLILNSSDYLKYTRTQQSIPDLASFEGVTINGMAVLQIDFDRYTKQLKDTIYGS